MESKLNGQMDSHCGCSAHLWVVQISLQSLQIIVVIDDYDMYMADYNALKFPSSLVTVLHTSGWSILKRINMLFDPNIPCGSRVMSIFTN